MKHDRYLVPHAQYQSILSDETGWKLKVEFATKVEDTWITKEDPYIKESQMREFHHAIKTIVRVFGIPNAGDFIQTKDGISLLIEKTFDIQTNTITLMCEA